MIGRPSGLEGDDRWARAAWTYVAEARSPTLHRLIEADGAVEALRMLRAGSVRRRALELHPQARPVDLEGWEARIGELDLDGIARACDQGSLTLLVPGDVGWPTGLDRLDDPPPCVFVRGDPDLEALVERSVALVGSRAATEYGLRTAGDLADGLVTRGFTVVSGAAYGIDAAAHRAALAADGRCVAVLACGADRYYPGPHRGLIDAVARSGAVVSESPPGAAPYRWRFLARNRIIAALSSATVVVEAGLRSGSLSTAREAREHHLPVGAVPGPVSSATSAGCHALVRDTDAVLVTDAAEVAELAASMGEHLAPARDRGPSRPEDHLDEVSYRVWAAVPTRGSASTERLGVSSGVRAEALAGILAALEVDGLVVRDSGRWRKGRVGRK
ncbi:DNA-processing protein DprA [Oryzobacter telluris]|uniref:DNA-processing protein DprA n=1 Tax=Oryzobacter telluris TaxID=3149179 RepID=UPI00370D3C4F